MIKSFLIGLFIGMGIALVTAQPQTNTTVATVFNGSAFQVPNQATGDIYYAASSTTIARLAKGTNGQVLTSNGTLPTWTTPAGGLPSGLTWTDGNLVLSGTVSDHFFLNLITDANKHFTIHGANATSGSFNAGPLNLLGGNANSDPMTGCGSGSGCNGGDVTIYAGLGIGDGILMDGYVGGSVYVRAGYGQNAAVPGDIEIGSNGTGHHIELVAGDGLVGVTENGGDITLTPGTKAGSGTNGHVIVTSGGCVGCALTGTTGAIGGGSLTAGTCASGTATVTGATTDMGVIATPVTYPGDGTDWSAYVSAANTVTVKVCALVVVTPTSTAYNVRVIQ